MNISFVVDSLSYGGAGRVVSIIANSLKSKNNNVSIILLYDSYNRNTAYHLNRGIRVFSIKDIKPKTYNRWYDYVRFIRNINRIRNVDVCIAFLNVFAEYACVACMASKTKIICCERNDPNNSPTASIYRMLRNPLYFLSDKVIVQTKDMKLFFPRIIQNKSKIIFNPVNPALSQIIRRNTNSKIVISVGKLTGQKNYALALKGFKEFHKSHKDYYYYICGEGSLRQEIERLIHEYELDGFVKLCGNVQNVFDYLSEAKVFIMSSKFEGMPNALMEAMAIGVPSISTDHPIGGAKELIKHGYNGFLIPVDDHKALSHYLTLLCDNINIYNSISFHSREVLYRFSEERIIEKWEDVILEVYNGTK